MSPRRRPLELGPRPRGICQVCGTDRTLKRDGTLRRHEIRWVKDDRVPFDGGGSAVCLGSGEPPR